MLAGLRELEDDSFEEFWKIVIHNDSSKNLYRLRETNSEDKYSDRSVICQKVKYSDDSQTNKAFLYTRSKSELSEK